MATIQVHEFETDQSLVCRFMDHEFELTRDPSDDCSFGNWYMHVKDDEGAIVCDGWIDDSNGYTARTAMIAACDGAMLDHPTTWPDGI
ncbi:hypothetical protein [Aeromonas hydrophila]|uniref:hypothetical protein n=1 Tax=Aeromonas hydrophila TaxID=644 RepID=UPI0038D1B67C